MLSSLFVVLFPVNYLARTEGNYSLKHSVTHPQVMLSFFSIHFQFIIPLHLFIFSTDRPLSQTYTVAFTAHYGIPTGDYIYPDQVHT